MVQQKYSDIFLFNTTGQVGLIDDGISMIVRARSSFSSSSYVLFGKKAK